MSGHTPWLRDGRTVYVLEHDSWHKGEERFRNRWSFHVQGGPVTTELECEEIAVFAQAAPETAAERDLLKEINADLLEALKSGMRHSSGCYHIDADVVEAAISRAETPDTGADHE